MLCCWSCGPRWLRLRRRRGVDNAAAAAATVAGVVPVMHKGSEFTIIGLPLEDRKLLSPAPQLATVTPTRVPTQPLHTKNDSAVLGVLSVNFQNFLTMFHFSELSSRVSRVDLIRRKLFPVAAEIAIELHSGTSRSPYGMFSTGSPTQEVVSRNSTPRRESL